MNYRRPSVEGDTFVEGGALKVAFFSLFVLSLFTCFSSVDALSSAYLRNKKKKRVRKRVKRYTTIKEVRDVLIVGSGIAGMTAGIVAAQANLFATALEGDTPGGVLTGAGVVRDWPGQQEISVKDLVGAMRSHAEKAGCELLSDTVTKCDFTKYPFEIFTKQNKVYLAKTVILAMGAKVKKIGCRGEEEFFGRGVTAYAGSRGDVYRDKKVVVVGDGEWAISDARYLGNFAKDVTLIKRDRRLRSARITKSILDDESFSVKYGCEVVEIHGDENGVTGVVLKNAFNGEIVELDADAVFVAIEVEPNIGIVEGKIEIDSDGYIKTDEDAKTSVEGVFCAGDVSGESHKKAIRSAGQGAVAACQVRKFLGL